MCILRQSNNEPFHLSQVIAVVHCQVEKLLPIGSFYGVTVDPTLLEPANDHYTIGKIQDTWSSIQLMNSKLRYLPPIEFISQTWGSTINEMYYNGKAISEVSRAGIVIKVPLTIMGVSVATKLSMAGVRVCLTDCFDGNQALIAASMGVDYIAMDLKRYAVLVSIVVGLSLWTLQFCFAHDVCISITG